MRLTTARLVSVLRKEGYRVTPQRRDILAVMTKSDSHLSPSAIYNKVVEKHPGIGLITVYRLVDVLLKLNLVCKVDGKGGAGYLLRHPQGHHHHLVCIDCGKVVDFSNCDLEELERELAVKSGFVIGEHLLEFRGKCRFCRSVR